MTPAIDLASCLATIPDRRRAEGKMYSQVGVIVFSIVAMLTGTSDKAMFEIDGARHIETYWVPEYVDATMDKLTPFFARTL